MANVVETTRFIASAEVVVLLALTWFGVGITRRKIPGTPAFIGLCVSSALFLILFTFELQQTTISGFFLLARLEYLVLPIIPGVWLLLVLEFTNMSYLVHKTTIIMLLTWAAIIVVIVWTNDFHHLYYSAIEPTDQVGIAHYIPGPLYLFSALSYNTAFVIGIGIVVFKRGAFTTERRSTLTVLLATAFPLTGSLLYLCGFRPGGIDLTPCSILPTVLVFSQALFTNHVGDIFQIAHKTTFCETDQPTLIFDLKGRLLASNPAAVRLVSDSFALSSLPQHNNDDVPASLLGHAVCCGEDQGSFPVIPGISNRAFHYRRVRFGYGKNRPIGYLVLIDREEKLS